MKLLVFGSLVLVIGCAAQSTDSDPNDTSPGGKADGLCYGPVTTVDMVPPQWPPSRIGDPIAAYLPDSKGAEDWVRLELEDGSNVSLWAENGRVYWEQRRDSDGRFENSFDNDRNGYVDDLRTGVPGCLEHSYHLSDEAAAEQGFAET